MQAPRGTNGSGEMADFEYGQDPMRGSFGGAGRGDRLSMFQILWNRRGMILLVIVGCVLGFGAFALSRPKIYTRSCQIAVEPVFTKTVGDTLSLEAFLNTQAELIGRYPGGLGTLIGSQCLFYAQRLPDQLTGPIVEVGTVFSNRVSSPQSAFRTEPLT